ncbi:hypothetical protein [Pontibacter arcticus]|uniref:YtxH-like protein n=1 Tax=Pontibacter arcticus TaxID=2080288 RepID=A0A364RD37_9BACT|nr:hypothetical protein [Pontibacter arcticus]RAU82258.1 hypothetical protein DP923_10720 [Pontibacter arcticus]
MRTRTEYTSLGEGKANFTNSSIGHIRNLESIQQHYQSENCETCEGMSDTTKLTLGLVASAGVGLLAGLLLAPQKGMDTPEIS